MLEHARRDLGIQTVLGVAESMPFESGRFDFLTMGYALRHVKDLSTAFAEFHRVLRPGGRLCILEITCPTGRIRQAVLRGYIGLLSHIVHILGPASPRTPELWSYYWWTIQQCVGPPRVAGALRDAGFENVEHRLELGLFSEYTARSPNFRNPSDPQVAPER